MTAAIAECCAAGQLRLGCTSAQLECSQRQVATSFCPPFGLLRCSILSAPLPLLTFPEGRNPSWRGSLSFRFIFNIHALALRVSARERLGPSGDAVCTFLGIVICLHTACTQRNFTMDCAKLRSYEIIPTRFKVTCNNVQH